MLTFQAIALMAASSVIVSAFRPWPLLGPVFEYPTSLCESDIFQTALKNLTSTLDYAGSSGGVTPYGKIPLAATSLAIGAFDNDTTLFSYQYSSPALQAGTVGVKNVTEDSVFRIGSGSKLITVYLFLIEAGAKYWSHPITEFVPQLAEAAKNCSASANPTDCIDWEHVTLGSLASHVSGIPRDYAALFDLTTRGLPVAQYGFPTLPIADLPICGSATKPCTVEQYLAGYASLHPLFAPYTTPVYSNGAFALLAFALEKITNRSFPEMLQTDLFDKLDMTHSSYSLPNDTSDAVIPLGEASGFAIDIALEGPVGGFYSSQNDMSKMAQSILNAKLLSPTTIRQWMKPDTHTSYLKMSVGKPWEIWRNDALINRTVDIYTKSGDLFSYSTLTVLIPDYNVGFVVLAAGNQTTSTVEKISDTVVAALLPALEVTAREQSQQKYGGTYKATHASLASNITLTTRPGEPGLIVESWFSNGTDFLTVIGAGIYKAAVDIRLYPTNLVQQVSPTVQHVQYRAMIQDANGAPDGGVFSSETFTWAQTETLTYGFVNLEDFLFVVADGKVVSVSPRVLRTTLSKAA